MIKEFTKEYRWLSNFEYVEIEYEGFTYPTTENAYQASKTYSKRIKRVFTKITPSEAQALGQEIHMREDWNDIKLKVMRDITRLKFSTPSLKAKLLSTEYQELIEGNYWGDVFWGICKDKGENHLGKIIMKIRSEYANL